MGCAASGVAIGAGGLLPHLFTLTVNVVRDGGRFLSLIPGVAAGFPLGNMSLCVARTFLLPQAHSLGQDRRQATDHTSALFLHILSFVSPSLPCLHVRGDYADNIIFRHR